MLQITRSGRIADAIASVRDVPARVIPYAAAVALTKSAKLAQADVVASLPRVFDRPTRYTLNATRIETATARDLTARVAVKDQASGGAVAAESFLKPAVFGGRRNEKGIEKSLRLKGVLPRGASILPGSGIKLDQYGNVSRVQYRKIQADIFAQAGFALHKDRKRANETAKFRRKESLSRRGKNDVFVGVPRHHTKDLPAGIWLRDGRNLRALLVFEYQQLDYHRILDFHKIAETVVKNNFQRLFIDAATSIYGRR